MRSSSPRQYLASKLVAASACNTELIKQLLPTLRSSVTRSCSSSSSSSSSSLDDPEDESDAVTDWLPESSSDPVDDGVGDRRRLRSYSLEEEVFVRG